MEKLYNHIILPDTWPPRYDVGATAEPMPVPYLEHPPAVICVDVGRQLFVDDFLIEETTLSRVYYQAKKYEGNPVLTPQTWEEVAATLPGASPKSGGVWYHPEKHRFEMWYEAGWLNRLAYAFSDDGIHWERPALDIKPGTNLVLPDVQTDSTTVIAVPDQEPSYYLFVREPGGEMPGYVSVSADGLHWAPLKATTPVYDRSTIFYNPFRKKWVYSIRTNFDNCGKMQRARKYRECGDLLTGAQWQPEEAVKWMCTDALDKEDPYIRFSPQLYNFDAVAYESIMLGMFQVFSGPENNNCQPYGIPKITELIPAYSRDGFHFSRPSREPFLRATRRRGDFDMGYVQSVGGVCVIVGDELWFYYIGFSGDEQNRNSDWMKNGMYANGATGLAKLRRDGFASMSTEKAGSLTTRKLESTGRYLFVNAQCRQGALRAELLTAEGRPVPGYTVEDCLPFLGDSTRAQVVWKSQKELPVQNLPFRLRFYVEKGALYSFWLSPSEMGESRGFPAAGEVALS